MPDPTLTRANIDATLRAAIERARTDGDEDGADTAELTRLLVLAWHDALAPLFAAGMIDLIDADGDGTVTLPELNEAEQVIAAAVAVTFVAAVLAGVQGVLGRVYARTRRVSYQEPAVREWMRALASIGEPSPDGTQRGVRAVMRLGGPDTRALAWLQRHHTFWITASHGRVFEPAITGVVEQILKEGLSRPDAAARMEQALAAMYGKGVGYWGTVATAAVTETRTFAQTVAYEAAGVEFAEVDTVPDKRRTDVCTYLEGKRIRVSDLRAWMEAKMRAATPEEALEAGRFWKDEEVPIIRALIEGNDGIIPASMGGPGYHFRCRSRLQAVSPNA